MNKTNKVGAAPSEAAITERIDALLAQMTLAEKVGQLAQVSGAEFMPGPKAEEIIHLGSDKLGYWSTDANGWIQDTADFDIWIGADSFATLHAVLGVVE